MAEGLLHHLILGHALELLLHRAPEAVYLVAAVHPSHSTAAKALLQHLAEVGGKYVALDERVAVVGYAQRSSKTAYGAQLMVKGIHAAGLALRVVVDGHNAIVFLRCGRRRLRVAICRGRHAGRVAVKRICG